VDLAYGTPALEPGQGWNRVVTSTCVESGGEKLVLDPLAPLAEEPEVWKRLDARPPTAVVILKPDHVRDVDVFVRRYGARALGPRLFFREDIPKTDLEFIEEGDAIGTYAAAFSRSDQSTLLEKSEVLDERWKGHVERLRQFADRRRAAR
jgi:hypothetical protein